MEKMDARVAAVTRELKAEIVRRDYSVKSAIEAAGLNYATTRRYFAGEREMPIRVLLQICAAIDASADEVFKRAEG